MKVFVIALFLVTGLATAHGASESAGVMEIDPGQLHNIELPGSDVEGYSSAKEEAVTQRARGPRTRHGGGHHGRRPGRHRPGRRPGYNPGGFYGSGTYWNALVCAQTSYQCNSIAIGRGYPLFWYQVNPYCSSYGYNYMCYGGY